MSFHKQHQLKLSPLARQDMVDILRYTGETWGKSQLLVYRDKINDALEIIRETPEIGHGRDDLPSTHLAFLVGSHTIIYRVKEDFIGIVRILHQRMSIARHL